MGLAREAGTAVDGTRFARVRGQARSHPNRVAGKASSNLWELACQRCGRNKHYKTVALTRALLEQ